MDIECILCRARQSVQDWFTSIATTALRLYKGVISCLKGLWIEGYRNGRELFGMVQRRGFIGSYYAVRRLVVGWRTREERVRLRGTRRNASPSIPLVRHGSNRLAWLLTRSEIVRQPDEDRLASMLMELSGPIASAVQSVHDFGTAIWERHLPKLQRWLSSVMKKNAADEIWQFAGGLKRD